MKFIHIADMHFDIPFSSLNSKVGLGDARRLEQRKIFNKVIEYIKENNIDFLFISGDLYEHTYTKKSTIDYINNCFKEIPKTKIFISPGNHDPYILDSYYNTYSFCSNVYIFKGNLEKKEIGNINIYGMGFTSFYMDGYEFKNFEGVDNSKLNILLLHCDLNGAKDKNGFTYNNINEAKLKALNFDYIAMGHIHKTNYISSDDNNILYSGSPISMGFDELGEHGMIVGEFLENKELNLNFIKLDDREFVEKVIYVDKFNSAEELIMNIQGNDFNPNNFYKIVLKGKRKFEINTKNILKLININNLLKVKDLTKINYDLDKISKENNIRGYFVKEALRKLEAGEATEEEIEKAIEIGLSVM